MAGESEAEPVTAAVLAEWIGVNERTVRDLADRRLVVRAKRGFFDLKASVQTYFAHVRDIAANRTGDENTNRDLTAQRARLAREQADQVELKNRIVRGEFIEAVAAEARWSDEMVKLRARMLAVSSDVSQQLLHLSQHDILIVDRAIRDAMTDAAE